jgi:translation elongation factor EF-1alpha
MAEIPVGVITHYFGHINVAAIRIDEGVLAVGDTVHIKGHTADFTTKIEAMQIEHAKVASAQAGQNIGIKVPGKAHEHDRVFKVVPDA